MTEATDDSWDAHTRDAAHAFDLVADVYARDWGGELDRLPDDRRFVDDFGSRVTADAPVLEVGAGPGQVARRLASGGVHVIATDISRGQLLQARILSPTLAVAVTDLARLPVRDLALAGIAAFYCLIYGPADHLDAVFQEWHRALRPGGLIAFAVHAGSGSHELKGELEGRAWRLTVVLREPDDMLRRLGKHGFTPERVVTRPPLPHEMPADHLFVIAARDA